MRPKGWPPARSLTHARAAAVAETVEAVRRIEAEMGVTPAALDKIKEKLIGARHLGPTSFPPGNFPVPQGEPGKAYRLSEHGSHRASRAAAAGAPGRQARRTITRSRASTAKSASDRRTEHMPVGASSWK